ncbi:uncharacterized protein KY384_009055 [Bacidia gigantensis]|uniref:uncharacterized protein n=1 Tax=Bacidia gigantensis TaxID=2732470 RepID=UPI001D0591E1|nr:uncharacterized protein KY384_009055 [Bacidia gigantensis]KAG8525411.1 hypothetical protein KY384_009055 [Bacidia gigantensis]
MAKKKANVPAKPKKGKIAHQKYIQNEINKAKSPNPDLSSIEKSNAKSRASSKATTRLPVTQHAGPTKSVPMITFLKPRYPPDTTTKPLDPVSPGLRPTVKLPYSRKGRFPFLDLPGELRNKIYAYALPRETFHLYWVDRSQRTKTLTYGLPLRPMAKQPCLEQDVLERRGATRRSRGERSGYHNPVMTEIYTQVNPISLLWVCSKMYPEVSSIFYSLSTFRFNRIGTIRHFLKNLTQANRVSIQSLTLQHQTYGHPSSKGNSIWKWKADKAWQELCWRIPEECPSLTNLNLELNYKLCPMTFGKLDLARDGCFSTRWMLALWGFQDFGIKRISCVIRSDIVDPLVLEVACRELREELLGEDWDADAEAKRDAWGFSKMTPILDLT